ncbi:MAG TPA: xanthine dehydrogenase family protein molybdopterin-binding subunit [Usitatibacter sp.]|nr:xanthine dehydrogenase family protein molybdopterin-binding subunit [Usitatibacter sp.]
MTVSRRTFLKSSAAVGGALVIGFWLPAERGRLAHAQQPAKKPVPPNAFLRVDKDGSVTVLVKHLEFGQGVMTSLPMLVAEELDCDWGKVRAQLAPAAPEYAHTAFGMQMTGGSSSVWNSYEQLRTAGAQARLMLMQAAAAQWKVKESQVGTRNGMVVGPGGRKLAYGQLTEAASKLPVPETVALKDPKQFRLVGKPTKRLDSAEKVNGKAAFGLDVKRPNLHTAVVAHPPVFGAKVRAFNAEKVKAVRGVTHVVELSNGVAVVGRNFWAVRQGREALEVDWDLGPNAGLSTEELGKRFREMAKTPGKVARKADNADALKGAARTIVAEYEVPFLAHAAMEPLNCTVEARADGAELWVGSQFQTVDQAAAAKVLGLKPEQVKLNTMLAGGGFGRRANPASDYVVEACEIAKAAKVPVKVVWTREDDIRGGYYRPMYVHRVEAGLDAQGRLVGWNHTIVGPSIISGTAFEPMMMKEGIDPTSVEGVADTPYAIPNLQVNLHTVNVGVPVLWWRSVGHSHTAFVMETMIDELAAEAKQDPVAYRRALLASQPRVLGVLDLVAAKSGWGSAPPRGVARGIAVHESFGSVCAQVAEVSLDGDRVRVHRVVAAFDCGRVVNPLTVEAQVQSAIAFGLSGALHGRISFKDGRVEQSNFHDYPVLRIDEMPRIEVHLARGGDKPTGVGEPGTPPIAPAVANALFALTGKRVRVLPFEGAVRT